MSRLAKEKLERAQRKGRYSSEREWQEANQILANAQGRSHMGVHNGQKIYANHTNGLYHDFIYINHNLLRIEKKLGEGAFGNVKLVSDDQGNKYVIKVTDAHNMPADLKGREEYWLKKHDRLHGEAERNRHPNRINHLRMLQAQGYQVSPKKLAERKHYAVQNLATGKELKAILNMGKQRGEVMHTEAKLEIAVAICKELADLHNNHKAVHRDLKPENMFYDIKSKKATLIDFGITFKNGEYCPPCGTPGYWAPEVKRSNTAKYSDDIYSLGVIFKEIGISVPMVDKMTSTNPNARPSINEVTRLFEGLLNRYQARNQAPVNEVAQPEPVLEQKPVKKSKDESRVLPPTYKFSEQLSESSSLKQSSVNIKAQSPLKNIAGRWREVSHHNIVKRFANRHQRVNKVAQPYNADVPKRPLSPCCERNLNQPHFADVQRPVVHHREPNFNQFFAAGLQQRQAAFPCCVLWDNAHGRRSPSPDINHGGQAYVAVTPWRQVGG